MEEINTADINRQKMTAMKEGKTKFQLDCTGNRIKLCDDTKVDGKRFTGQKDLNNQKRLKKSTNIKEIISKR